MDRQSMDRLIAARLEAVANGDAAGTATVYTPDVEHDFVGFPGGPLYGRDEALIFHELLRQELRTDEMVPIRAYYGEDFCVVEHEWRGTVTRSLLGIEGRGRRAACRVLHIWEFRDGLISRENVWLDVSALIHQVTAEHTTTGVAS